jgi:hypothetical protein
MVTYQDSMDIKGFRLLAQTDLAGHGDGMQIMRRDDHIFVGHMGDNGMGTSVVDVSDPRKPKVVHQIRIPANSRSHKVQVAGDIMMVNHEQQLFAGEPFSSGLAIYDVSKAAQPRQIGWLPINGLGIHRMWWTGGDLVYFSVREHGWMGRFLMSADVSDPTKPEIVSRWWYPGQWTAGGETPTWKAGPTVRAHHVIVEGDRAYGGWGDAGFMIFDVSERDIQLIANRKWTDEIGGSSHTHTGLPLLAHNVVAVTDEPFEDNCQEAKKIARVFDVTNEAEPALIGTFPEPDGPFCEAGGRYGPHNFHENRPGTFQSQDIVFLTYFNAGLRVYDMTRPATPLEVGRFLPPAPDGQSAIQLNDVLASEDGLVFVSDRERGGVYILEYLGETGAGV